MRLDINAIISILVGLLQAVGFYILSSISGDIRELRADFTQHLNTHISASQGGRP